MSLYPSAGYTPLVDDKEYLLITTDFLLGGGGVSSLPRAFERLGCRRSIRPMGLTPKCTGWQGYTMLKTQRQVRLDWPASNTLLNAFRVATNAANLTEPTQEMVLAEYLQSRPLTATSGDIVFEGRLRKILGHIEEAVGSGSCCQQQCPLGRSTVSQARDPRARRAPLSLHRPYEISEHLYILAFAPAGLALA